MNDSQQVRRLTRRAIVAIAIGAVSQADVDLRTESHRFDRARKRLRVGFPRLAARVARGRGLSSLTGRRAGSYCQHDCGA